MDKDNNYDNFDYSEIDEINNSHINNLQQIVFNNIDKIKETKPEIYNIVMPQNNNFTKKLMLKGYSLKQACSICLSSIFLIYLCIL